METASSSVWINMTVFVIVSETLFGNCTNPVFPVGYCCATETDFVFLSPNIIVPYFSVPLELGMRFERLTPQSSDTLDV